MLRTLLAFLLLGAIGAMMQDSPIDVPGVEVEIEIGQCFGTFSGCWVRTKDGKPVTREQWLYSPEMETKGYRYYRWGCADKSRVLLTAENGDHWCHKLQP